MNVEVLKNNKNKKGEIKTKIVRVTNKVPRKGLDFNSINTLYKELLNKYKPENILIVGKPMDGGFVTILDNGKERNMTLKNSKHLGSDLRYAEEDYYSSLPKDKKDELHGKFYSVDITISM